MKLIALILIKVFSSFLEYRFGRDYGKYYFDYSGNSNHGVSGYENSDSAKRTDRGIYLESKTGSFIKGNNSFILPSSFYISSWIMISNTDTLFISKGDINSCYYLKVSMDKEIKIPYTEYLFIPLVTANAPINSWFLFSLYYSDQVFQQFFNEIEVSLISMAWNDADGFLYIGPDTSGRYFHWIFVWNFIINESLISFSNYLGDSSNYCLTGEGSCSLCTNSTKDVQLGIGCLSDFNDSNFNAYNSQCEYSDNGCSSNINFICPYNDRVCLYNLTTYFCYEKDFDDGFEKKINCQCRIGYFNNNNSICACKNNYYGDLVNEDCIICEPECLICSELECITCKDSSAKKSQKTCVCEEGYFMNSDYFCEKCNNECLICNELECITCKDPSAKKSQKTCVCEEGYYMNSNYFCQSCDKDCLMCNEFECTTCRYNNSQVIGKYCECEDGYLKYEEINGSLKSCVPCLEECSACDSFSSCTSCISDNAILNANKRCQCEKGFYNNTILVKTDSCKACHKSCETCDSKGCLICKDNLSIITKQGICERNYFYGFITINSKNKISLCFTEDLNVMLNSNNIQMKVDDIEVTYFLKEINQSCLYLSTDIKNKTIQHLIEIQINKTIVLSKNLSILLNYTFETYTFITVTTTSDENIIITLLKSKQTAQTTSTSIAGMALLSNPLALWSLLNNIQLFTFMPLNSVPYPDKFKKITISLLNYNIVPNLLEYFIDPNSTSEPYKNAIEIGMTSSVILLNCGKLFVIFCLLLLIKLFISCLSILSSLIENWHKIRLFEKKWTIRNFLRFWIEFYLELVIYSFIQLKTDIVNPVQGNLNMCTSFTLAFFGILTPFFMIYTMKIPVKQPEDNNLDFIYFTLYDECKNNRGFISVIYYPLFLFRRLIYALTQVFLLNYPFAQAYLNTFFAFIMCSYVIIYRPFKEKPINFIQITGELCIFFVFALSSVFLFSESQDLNNYIEDTCIYLIFGQISLNILVSFYYFSLFLKNLCKKLEKQRAQQFIKAAKLKFNIS